MPVEHTYSLVDSRNIPWATLVLSSNAPSPRFLPAYFHAQPVHGALHLRLRNPETILGIELSLSGTIMAANAPDPRVFWILTRVLWNADLGDPSAAAAVSVSTPSPSPSPSPSLPPPPPPPPPSKPLPRSKLLGAYSWPFLITLPSTCTVSIRSGRPVTLPLPPSFSEKGASQFINYEFTVRIRRGPFRIDSKLGTHFGFAPRTRPPPPSLLRQLSLYQDNNSSNALPPPLPGPDVDPDGWSVLPPIRVRAKLFPVVEVDALCTFALALPLSYARGHPVPLVLTIRVVPNRESEVGEQAALDRIFSPENISVLLIREVRYDTGCPDCSSCGRYSTQSRSRLGSFGESASGWGGATNSEWESSPADASLAVTATTPPPPFNGRRGRKGNDVWYVPHVTPEEQSQKVSSSQSAFYTHPSASTTTTTTGTTVATDRTSGRTSKKWGSLLSRTSSTLSSSFSFGGSSKSEAGSESASSKSKCKLKSKSNRNEKEKEIRAGNGNGMQGRGRSQKVTTKLAFHGARTPVTSAVWWPRESRNGSECEAGGGDRYLELCLEGEIILPKDLVPSFEFGGFSVKYALALLPFQAPGLELLAPSFPPNLSSSPYSGSSALSLPTPTSASPPNSSSSSTPTSAAPGTPGASPALTLTNEPLLLSPIAITTLPFSPASSSPGPASWSGPGSGLLSPPASPGVSLPMAPPPPVLPVPFLAPTSIPTLTMSSMSSSTPTLTSPPPLQYTPPAPLSIPSTLTQITTTPTPRSRAPPTLDTTAQRRAHAERVRKPVVWGLFNQFVAGGASTLAGPGSAGVSMVVGAPVGTGGGADGGAADGLYPQSPAQAAFGSSINVMKKEKV